MQVLSQLKDRIYSYEEYKLFMEKHSIHSSCYNDSQVAGTRLNIHRMKRIEKTFSLTDEMTQTLKSFHGRKRWLVIAEPWCGDGAQILPILKKTADATEGRITLGIILRDQNNEVMNMFLTNGSRSIPILICLDEKSGDVEWIFGPRPTRIKNLVEAFKKSTPGYTHEDLVYNIHKWYSEDKGETIMEDLLTKIYAKKITTLI